MPKKLTPEEIKSRSIKIHNNVYDYSKTNFSIVDELVSIICTKHGVFKQKLRYHIRGSGCKKCSKGNTTSSNKPLKITINKKKGLKERGWKYSDWEDAGNISTHFNGFSLYIIECISKTERFIKVGKTFVPIGIRFKELPYKFKVHSQVYHNAYAISVLENTIHKKLKNASYTPGKPFSGNTECFTLSVLDEAISLAESGYEG